jgi:hypothetical protein
MSDMIISPPEPFPNIQWKNNDKQSELVFDKIQISNNTFTVEVGDKDQVSQWQQVLYPKVSANWEHEVCDGEPDVTIFMIQAAVNITALLTLASLIAYGLSRGYSVTGKKTGTAIQFEFKPKKRQGSYTISAVFTCSRFNVDDEENGYFSARLIDNNEQVIGTLHITPEHE